MKQAMIIDHELLAKQIEVLVQLQRTSTKEVAASLEGIICLLEAISDDKY